MDRVWALGRGGLERAVGSPWTGSGPRAGPPLLGQWRRQWRRQPGLVLVSTGPQGNGETGLIVSEGFVVQVTVSGALGWERDAWSGCGLSPLRPVCRALASLDACLLVFVELLGGGSREPAVSHASVPLQSVGSRVSPLPSNGVRQIPHQGRPQLRQTPHTDADTSTLRQTPRTKADAPHRGQPRHRGQPHHRGRCQGGRRSQGHWSPEGLSRVGFCKCRGVGGQISAVSEHTSLLPVSVLFREAPGVSLPFLFEEVRPRFLKASPLIHGVFVLWSLGGPGSPDKDAAPHSWAQRPPPGPPLHLLPGPRPAVRPACPPLPSSPTRIPGPRIQLWSQEAKEEGSSHLPGGQHNLPDARRQTQGRAQLASLTPFLCRVPELV